MSSDESTSTQISTISSQLGADKKLKPHIAEQWEINLIGNFLLRLYHRLLITAQNSWTINKSDLRKEFKDFLTADLRKKLQELNGTDNIGTLLHRCGFIINTVRSSNLYKIKSNALYDFRNKKLKEQDNWRLNNDVNTTEQLNDNVLTSLVDKGANIVLEDKFEVNKDEPKNLLEYQGTTMKQRQPNYCPTNMSCSICQEDFTTMEKYEDHIQKHNDETDFEYLNTMSKHTSSIFTISYRLCKNSHYFCFDIETQSEELVIEKIIIVQSRSFFYVHNMRVPYSMPESGCEQFYVDSHLFTKYVEQPIVVICHLKNNQNTRIIEEHHFMRCEEFPKVCFAIKPYLLPDKKKFKPKFELADYFPPKEIQVALNDEFYNEKLMRVSNEFRDYVRNEKKLQPQTIGPSLNILLQIEDLDTLKQYFNLTQRDVKLRCFKNEYSFRLRPKQRIFVENILTVFDEVILTSRPNISTKPEDLIQLMLQNKDDIDDMDDTYVGQVEDVNSSRISFKCYRKIDINRTYSVICRPSRLNIRYQYRSLEMLPMNMHFLKNFLFPAQVETRPLSTKSLTLYNKNIGENPEQLQTVRNIAEGPRNDATYIIFGPPGTGKTTTVVEAILQVLKRADTKILVTASSNSACDEVAIRLCKQLDQLDMARSIVRIYSRSSENRIDTIDDELLQRSNMYNGQFYPDIAILHEYRIVVCTLSIVAKLATGKFGRGEFGGTQYTHVFIDEVAATMEAEALIGITSILTPKSSLIISGDHKQLGPILQSKRAEELGLGVSLMDRLMARECYRVNTDTGEYDRTIQTRLRLNFRSHPDIVNLYSGMYYNHGLEAKANIDDVSLVNRWHLARDNKEYPIIFHCIDSPSCSDNQSKSLYNLQELNVVMDYVKDLMYFGINNKPVNETDIGIISPYKKQYKCIQEQLNLRKWFKIETGSVETFQGKEKNIIIVSFVRSGTSTLGFLENPRRLNVTISRAKSLLIMIGNPKTLSLNSDFEYIIKECRRHNTLIGYNPKEHFKHSTEKLNDNRNRNNSENRRNNNNRANNNKAQQHQRNSNTKSKPSVGGDNQMPALNNLLQQLNVTNPEDAKNANKRARGNERGRRAGKSKNNQESSKQNSENNSDVDDDDSDDDDNEPSGAGRKQNHQGIKNIRSHHQPTTRGQGGSSGKISKQYNKPGKPNTKDIKNKQQQQQQQQQKSKIESLFDDLPQVPKINDNRKKDAETTVKALMAEQHVQPLKYVNPMTTTVQQPQNFNMPNISMIPHMAAYHQHQQQQQHPHHHQPLPLWFNPPSQQNYGQTQQQQHPFYMQQQQNPGLVNNPPMIYPQTWNLNGMPPPLNYNNNNMMNSNTTDNRSNNNNNNKNKYSSSTSGTGMSSKNVAKIPPTSTSANKTATNKNNKAAAATTTATEQKKYAGDTFKNSSSSNVNSKASAKAADFNSKASAKAADFNNKASAKAADFNNKASAKTADFNNKASGKTADLNNKASGKTADLNNKASGKTADFNNKASAKTADFNNKASAKTADFNNKASAKAADFNNKASEKTAGSVPTTKAAVTSEIPNKSTSHKNNTDVSNDIRPLTVKPTVTTSNVKSSTTISNNNRPITETLSSTSAIYRQSSAVSPNQVPTSSANRLSTYETAKQVSSSEANAILSSSGAIRKLPIYQTNAATSTTATASVRPVIRQTSTHTPTITSASADTFSYSSPSSNWRTNTNFVDSYNDQTRLTTTTAAAAAASGPKTDTQRTSTSFASANTNNYRNSNNIYVDSYADGIRLHTANSPFVESPQPSSRPIRHLQFDERQKKKQEENKCIIS